MVDFLFVLLDFVLFCASAAFGMLVRPRLSERQQGRDTVEMMTLVIGMLVTFAALVLGLITASVKTTYDDAGSERQRYALQLSQLDQCLRDYGAGAEDARALLRSYTAGVVASVWPSEPPPVGVSFPDVTGMPRLGAVPGLAVIINQVGLQISGFVPADAFHTHVAETCRETYRDVLRARMAVIEDVGVGLSTPFYRVLVFWLMVIFACFGLIAPRHMLTVIVVGLCALSLSSALFVVVDLSSPYDGLFAIQSTGMRAALASMMAP